MRKQYHLRDSERGLLAWDVDGLIRLAEGLPVEAVSLQEIRELDQTFWFGSGEELPTCRRVAEHAQLIQAADLRYPIILDSEGRVMDGMHRVCKALNLGHQTIRAVRLGDLPEPDFVGVPAEDLPYEETAV